MKTILSISVLSLCLFCSPGAYAADKLELMLVDPKPLVQQPLSSDQQARRGGRGGGSARRGSSRSRSMHRGGRPSTRPVSRPGNRPGHRPSRPGHRPAYGGRRDFHRGRGWIWAAGAIPLGAAILTYDGGRPVYACQAEYQGYVYDGRVRDSGPCYITVNGRSVGVSRYMIRTD